MTKVFLLTTGHPVKDERIYYKIGLSLIKNNYRITIFSTQENQDSIENEIRIIARNFTSQKFSTIKKAKYIQQILKASEPRIIHCFEPFAVIIAWLHKIRSIFQRKVSIIYDITEWYPENISSKRKGFNKFLTYIAGSLINLCATNVSNYLIIGEKSKLKRYRFFSPLKPYSIISYYPILEFYPKSKSAINEKELIFGYAGVISFSRGLKIIGDSLITLKQIKTELKIHFTICGRFENEKEKDYLKILEENNIQVEYYDWVEYPDFPNLLRNTNICFDLRAPNKIYERSLPIRIFDYMALGKCIIASNFQPIKEILETNDCGILVNPLSKEEILNGILSLIDDPEKIIRYGSNGRKAVEKFYNWSVCEDELLKVYSQISLK